jgi:glucose-6-phosphate dehydrogenase assembly protein OpcA
MKDIYYYQPTKTSELSASLAKVFENMEAEDNHYIKAATINSILVVDAGYDKNEIETLIDTLTLVHPNRAFLIVLDAAAPEIKAEFSTRCHKISKTDHVCSEVVRLIAPPAKLPQVKTILRGNLITGVQTELILYQEKGAAEIYKQVADLSDQILFSSSIFEKDFSDLRLLLESSQPLIDLEWVKLGVWRDQIKDAFQQTLAREKLSELNNVEIVFNEEKCPGLLLAGWIAARLSLRLKGKSGSRFTLISKDSKEVSLDLKAASGGQNRGINQVNFIFENNSEYIRVIRKDQLDTEINFKEQLRTTRPIENLNFTDLLKRYFFVGESTINYRDSLSLALKYFQN